MRSIIIASWGQAFTSSSIPQFLKFDTMQCIKAPNCTIDWNHREWSPSKRGLQGGLEADEGCAWHLLSNWRNLIPTFWNFVFAAFAWHSLEFFRWMSWPFIARCLNSNWSDPTAWGDYITSLYLCAMWWNVTNASWEFSATVSLCWKQTNKDKQGKQTSQELRMLSSVTINCQITKIVMNSGSQLSEL